MSKPRINQELVETITATREVARDAYVRWSWIIAGLRASSDVPRAVKVAERARRKLPMDTLVIVDIWGWS